MILVGATGTGKSFIACALAHQACRKGYRALYRRASRLFHELTLARADGTYVRLLAKLARLDVLRHRRLRPRPRPGPGAPRPPRDPRGSLRHPLDHHHQPAARRPSGTTTSPTPTLADAICDRLLHNAHRLVLKGPSRRKEGKLDT